MTIRRFALDVRDDPEALRRIVTVCRRRNCRIVGLTYQADDGGLRLVLTGDAAQTRRAEHWLASVVDVLSVRRDE